MLNNPSQPFQRCRTFSPTLTIDLDTNTIECAMRPVALGRKIALLPVPIAAGSIGPIVARLIQTAKLNDKDSLAWLTDVLERIVSGRAKRNELPSLLPWICKNADPPSVDTA